MTYILCLCCLVQFIASQAVIKGLITDKHLNPVELASIELVGKGTGTYSDQNGHFSLEIDSLTQDAVLIIQHVAFQTKRVKVDDLTLQIQLSDAAASGSTVLVAADRIQRFRPIQRQILKEEINVSAAPNMARVLDSEIGVSFNANNQIMLQGLDPEYTLVLIDGVPALSGDDEPIRFDEINTFNIKKIEIIRGPSSFIYGRGAVGGVVNISTNGGSSAYGQKLIRLSAKEPAEYDANVSLNVPLGTHYVDFGAGVGQKKDDFSNRRENHYRGRIAAEFPFSKQWNLKTQVTTHYQTNDALNGNENSKNDLRAYANSNYTLSEEEQIQVKGLYTQTNITFEGSESTQRLSQFDFLYDVAFSTKLRAFFGSSLLYESYFSDFVKDFKDTQIGYGFFAAADWRVLDEPVTIDFLLGIRGDYHTQYSPFFSPKAAIALAYNNFDLRAELGRSFKSPTFTEMFSSFSNVTYDIIGSNLLEAYAEGVDIQSPVFHLPPSSFGQMKPENGNSFSASLAYRIPAFSSQFSLAYSITDLENYIELVHAISYTDERDALHKIYTYQNASHIQTETIDIKYSYRNSNHLNVMLGYQYLDAINVDDVEQIRQGKILSRYGNPVKLDDYGGLFNRSKHQVKFSISKKLSSAPLTVFLSANYRSPYGNRAKDNGNYILDTKTEYEDAYVLYHSALSYDFTNEFQAQIRIENIGDLQNRDLYLTGRKFQITINYKFK